MHVQSCKCNITSLLRIFSIWNENISIRAQFPKENMNSRILLLFWDVVHVRIHSLEKNFRDIWHIEWWEHLWEVFKSCNWRRGSGYGVRRLFFPSLLQSHSIFPIWVYPCLNLGPPHYTLICLGNQINLCVQYFYSPFSSFHQQILAVGYLWKCFGRHPYIPVAPTWWCWSHPLGGQAALPPALFLVEQVVCHL